MRRLTLAATLACVAAYTAPPDQAGLTLSAQETAPDDGSTNHFVTALMQATVSAAASSTAPETCDPSWCNCKGRSCVTRNDDEGCDLCSQKYLFVLSAGGRTGSTSLLEGLNAMPGVSLSGENFGVLEDLRAEFNKVSELIGRNGRQSPAAYFVPKPHGVAKHTLCGQQSMIARWAGANSSGKTDQIYGFKELLQLPSFDAGGEFASETPHLSSRPEVRSPKTSSAQKLAWRTLRGACLSPAPISPRVQAATCDHIPLHRRSGPSFWRPSSLARASF